MAVRRVAMFSMHTSPLAQPGTGDGGGMNVYVRTLATSLARAGVECDVLTRADAPGLPPVVEVERGVRVVHLRAGPPAPVGRHDLAELTDEMVDAALAHGAEGGYDALHANYWVSGAVAHQLKHRLSLPLVSTFHTLARVKADVGVDDDPARRARVEAETIACSDLVVASTAAEADQLVELYGAERTRIEVVPPGVDHEVFRPGDRAAARARLGLGDGPVLLFVGRIQPLKRVDLAVRCLAALDRHPTAELVVVGGPSGRDGEAEERRVRDLVGRLGVGDRVRFVAPQPHARLASYYRAADVCLVPSRTESFGLVALEAAACGTPVVAAAVGGLCSIVDHGVTGFLVEGREPAEFAAPVDVLLRDPDLAARTGAAAQAHSRRYAWSITAARFRRLYADLTARALVRCS